MKRLRLFEWFPVLGTRRALSRGFDYYKDYPESWWIWHMSIAGILLIGDVMLLIWATMSVLRR